MPHYPPPYSRSHGHPPPRVDGLLDQGQPDPDPLRFADPDPLWGRPQVPQSLLSAAEEYAASPLGQMTPLEQQREINRQRAMAGDPNYASIGPTPSRGRRLLDHVRHTVPRAVGDALKGGFYGTGAGALRIGQALIPGEQPRMAQMEQYGLGQIPEEGIGAFTGLLGKWAPEFTLAGDLADLGRVPGYVRRGEWGGAGLSMLAAVPFLGTPAVGLLKARRGARAATEGAGAAQEAQDAIVDRVIESPNIQRLIQTPAAEAAEGQRNLRGIMDYEAPNIQGTMEDVSVFEPPPGYRGTPHPFTESLLSSRTVPRVLDADFERGLEIMGPRAALNWYELGPARQFMDELGGPYSFDELNLIGGAASVQTPVHQEIANTAIIMFARKRGISIDEAIDEYFKVTRRPRGVTPEGLLARPWGLSDDTYARAGRYLDEGVAAPLDYKGPDWKVPSYVGARQGAGASPFANPALDTHERRRIWQAIQENPRLRRLAEAELTPAMRTDEVMPIRNAADYSRISDLYRGGQDRYGLITPAQYQAPRWVGGGQATGLTTSPTETFVEILADVTAATARDRGLGTSARELRELLGRALSGDDFLIHYPTVPRVPR